MRVAFKRAKGGTIWEWLIGFIAWGLYCHVEVICPDGRCFSSDERDGGVRFKQVDFDERWDIFTVPGSWDSGMLRWCEGEVGCGYDWPGALLCPWKLRVNDRNKWFCSEIVSHVLDMADQLHYRDTPFLPKVPTYYSPSDLAKFLFRKCHPVIENGKDLKV